MIYASQVLIFVLGCSCVVVSLSIASWFVRSRHGVGLSVALMMIEQSVSSICTLVFSAHSLYGTVAGLPESQWNAISTEWGLALRACMFTAMLISSTHLSLEVHQICKKLDNNAS